MPVSVTRDSESGVPLKIFDSSSSHIACF
jgi:hypothetical protein